MDKNDRVTSANQQEERDRFHRQATLLHELESKLTNSLIFPDRDNFGMDCGFETVIDREGREMLVRRVSYIAENLKGEDVINTYILFQDGYIRFMHEDETF